MRTDEPLEGLCSVYAESSLCELLDDFIEEQHLVSKTARQALAVVLVPTRVTIGAVQKVDYAQTATLAADVAALQSDVTGIDGNLSTAASVTVVENIVTTAIDDLDELAEVEF